ncbi:MAG: hypothetical protein KF745_01745 [Phycisphaeraceae bacterium]|nr:hypothetical protein [Phycisphaeraceae bacterium]
MARERIPWLGSRRTLAAAAAFMFLHSLLPASWTPWAAWGREALELIVSPIQRPIAYLARSTRGPVTPPSSEDERVLHLEEQIAQYKVAYQQRTSEIERLQKQIQLLQRGLALHPELPVYQFAAPVIGTGSDRGSTVLKVRTGRNKGITPLNAVAVVQGVMLVGRALPTGAPLSDVVPITDRRAGQVQGVVMLSDLVRGPTCNLMPVGDGTLIGDLEFPQGMTEPPTVEPGMTVRLSDDEWPAHALGLVIGVVERVGPKPTSAQRQQVVVRPQARLDRATEVIIRVTADSPDFEPDTPGAGGAP